MLDLQKTSSPAEASVSQDEQTDAAAENNNAKQDASQPERPKVPVDASVVIQVSDDKLSAYAIVRPPQHGGAEIDMKALEYALQFNKIRFGINYAALNEIVNSKIYNKLTLIASGKPPVNGVDGTMQVHFSLNKDLLPKALNDGTVDFKELGIVNNVSKDTLLCTITKATEGEPGKDVYGFDIIQKKGRDVKNPQGPNTVLNEEGTELRAAADGNLDYKGGVVSISEVLTINDNVDYYTGNINFNGSVVIRGDVKAGFTVKAKNNIKISGMVEGATIETGGDLTIDCGINGRGRANIFAGGDLKTKFIENCNVVVRGNIIAECIIESNVKCDGNVDVVLKKGAIIGGNVTCAKDLTAKNIGSPSHTATSICVGSTFELSNKLTQARKDYEVLTKELSQLQQIVSYCEPLLKQNKLPPDRVKMMNQAVLAIAQKQVELTNVTNLLEELNFSLNSFNTSRVVCKENLFTGVKVCIGNESYNVNTDMVRCSLYLTNEGINVGQI